MDLHGKETMLSAHLADFIDDLKFDALPRETIRMARLSFLDWLGSAARGGRERPAEIAISVLRNQGGSPQAVLLPSRERTSALNAALANGIASHILELDDVHRRSIVHAGAAVMPAAFAAAELVHASGRGLIEAIVAGYEVAIRVGEAVTPSHYHYWHNTGTCGTFGACAAAAKLLSLSREQTVWAIGSAGTQAAGLWEFLSDATMSKHLHAGKAAQNGLLAALLAKEGFSGATRILEGEKGFFRAMAPRYDVGRITEKLGCAPYRVEENSFKFHSSCRHTHPAIDVILDLARRNGINGAAVSDITVWTYRTAIEITNNAQPESVFAAKFSLPFCVALALKNGRCGLADFSEENLRDSQIRELMARVRLVVDDAIDAAHPGKWGVAVEVRMKSGEVYSGGTDYPRGDPENPGGDEALASKFRALTLEVWDADSVEAVLQTVMNLEKLEDVALLF
jgi:2-methylcitrate dehydratase PrpD